MRPIAMITYAALPDLTDDDRLVCAALAAQGAPTQAVVWDDPAVDWPAYSWVVLRSCWDYHTHVPAFRVWLERLQAAGVALLNPAPLVTENIDKRYLAGLEAKGIPTVPTVWLEPGSPADLAAILDDQSWEKAVVKPTISAGGANTWLTAPARARTDQPALDALLEQHAVMVQAYIPEVASVGEWSLMLFGGRYSHAVLKTPATGEFRIQAHYGGTAVALAPDPHVIAAAQRVVDALPEVPVYARVDGIVRAGELVLMELEVIEPVLFLGSDPAAAERFADAILAAPARSIP
jgi:glutathione synthase/RimK-type ligase-like ATP-grasp enzyme